jgi:DNA mismatch repair protein MutL
VSVPESEVSILLEQLISDVENEVPDANFSVTDLISKSLSKSLAIKNGQKLAPTEQEHLVNSLFACKEPSVSPTNRATFITMSIDELDKKFV